MKHVENCPFCHIDSARSPIVRSGELFTSILSNQRLVPGHALVVPNRHVEAPWDLRDDELLAMYAEARRLSQRMLESGLCKGTDIWQKTRPFLPPPGEIKVNHLHIHVIPSKPGEEVYDTQLRWTPDRFSWIADGEAGAMVELLGTKAANKL